MALRRRSPSPFAASVCQSPGTDWPDDCLSAANAFRTICLSTADSTFLNPVTLLHPSCAVISVEAAVENGALTIGPGPGVNSVDVIALFNNGTGTAGSVFGPSWAMAGTVDGALGVLQAAPTMTLNTTAERQSKRDDPTWPV